MINDKLELIESNDDLYVIIWDNNSTSIEKILNTELTLHMHLKILSEPKLILKNVFYEN